MGGLNTVVLEAVCDWGDNRAPLGVGSLGVLKCISDSRKAGKTSRSVPVSQFTALFISVCAPNLMSCSGCHPHLPVMCFPEDVRTMGQQQAWADDTLAWVWSPKEAEVEIFSESSLELLGHDVCDPKVLGPD